MILETAPPIGLDAQRKRRDVEQQHVADAALQNLACTAAPSATTSSGFSSVCGLRPKKSCTVRRMSGVRVVPPTSTTSSMPRREMRVGERLLSPAP